MLYQLMNKDVVVATYEEHKKSMTSTTSLPNSRTLTFPTALSI